jgi:putative ABC transport system permease protein
VRFAAASASEYKEVNFQGRNQNYVEVVGATPDIFWIDKQRLGKGRLLTAEDLQAARGVCVIGSTSAKNLFGGRVNPLGQSIQIGGYVFDVVGVLKERKLMRRGQNVLESENQKIYVPYSVLPRKFNPKQEVQQIDYVVSQQRDIARVQGEIKRLFQAAHGGVEDVEVKTQEEQYQQSRKTLANMKIGFSAIAGISLIVGGIGILNVMMANIAQRVREIGIRKAVGAKSRDILFQFLVESTIVSTTGGVAGLLGSIVVVFLLGFVFNDNPPVMGIDAVILATFSSIQVGIVFGIYPAIKAAQLDPIAALRYQ